MKAVVLSAFGPASNLELQELEKPEPGPNDVLVRVHATSVNPADIGLRSGMFGAMLPPPLVLGFDVAGTVEAVGVGVATGLVSVRAVTGALSPRRWTRPRAKGSTSCSTRRAKIKPRGASRRSKCTGTSSQSRARRGT